MSETQDYIQKLQAKDPEFSKIMQQETFKLDVAVAVTNLRQELKLSQAALANRVHVPQATISDLEEGAGEISVDLLSEIATVGKKSLSVQFI